MVGEQICDWGCTGGEAGKQVRKTLCRVPAAADLP